MIARGLLILAVCGSIPAGAVAAEGSITPHKAVYRIVGGEEGGVTRADGWVVANIEASCDGWSTQNAITFRVVMPDGRVVDSSLKASTWESRDGLQYRFSAENVRGESLTGDANIPASGDVGKVVFSQPPGYEMILPAGTMFPMTFNRRILAAARDGEEGVSAIIFDAGHSSLLVDTEVTIGGGDLSSDETGRGLPEIRGLSWPLRYTFSTRTADLSGNTQFHARLFDNGIYGDMLFDFGDFTFEAILEQIVPGTEPDC
jgi:hypothetical protein